MVRTNLFSLVYKFNVLRLFWSSRLRGELPCTSVKWTCEHVVPKSFFPQECKHRANNLHNLILLPYQLNNARSNFKYVEHRSNVSVPVCSCDRCLPRECCGRGYAAVTGFTPPDVWKGQISRAVLYMADKYPEYRDAISQSVLDIDTAHHWNVRRPPTNNEHEWNQIVKRIQGDSNPYCL